MRGERGKRDRVVDAVKKKNERERERQGKLNVFIPSIVLYVAMSCVVVHHMQFHIRLHIPMEIPFMTYFGSPPTLDPSDLARYLPPSTSHPGPLYLWRRR
jgi:hypothetical protein